MFLRTITVLALILLPNSTLWAQNAVSPIKGLTFSALLQTERLITQGFTTTSQNGTYMKVDLDWVFTPAADLSFGVSASGEQSEIATIREFGFATAFLQTKAGRFSVGTPKPASMQLGQPAPFAGWGDYSWEQNTLTKSYVLFLQGVGAGSGRGVGYNGTFGKSEVAATLNTFNNSGINVLDVALRRPMGRLTLYGAARYYETSSTNVLDYSIGVSGKTAASDFGLAYATSRYGVPFDFFHAYYHRSLSKKLVVGIEGLDQAGTSLARSYLMLSGRYALTGPAFVKTAMRKRFSSGTVVTDYYFGVGVEY